MDSITIETDNGEVEISNDQLPDGVVLADKSDPPKGLFNQDGVNSVVEDRLKGERSKVKSRLADDEEFNQRILHKHNVTLDDNGQPKQLDADFDKEAWKSNEAKKLTEPLKKKVSTLENQLDSQNSKIVNSAIISATNGKFEERWLKERGGVVPVVNMYSHRFGIDDNGNVALKDDNGFEKNGDGSNVSPDEFFGGEDFNDMLKDKTQGGSGFEQGGSGSQKNYSEEDIDNMSDEEFMEHREEIHASLTNQ